MGVILEIAIHVCAGRSVLGLRVGVPEIQINALIRFQIIPKKTYTVFIALTPDAIISRPTIASATAGISGAPVSIPPTAPKAIKKPMPVRIEPFISLLL
jgi:hypothetical protein